MLVRKFKRLLLVPGMAVPLVLVACSSDDSHSLMDTALVGAVLSTKGIDAKIEAAADEPFNGNERSVLKFNGDSFVFEIGEDGANGREDTKRTASVKMADAKQFEHKGAREFEGYDITENLSADGEETPAETLYAVVFAHTEPKGEDEKGMYGESHLAFGLWMVKGEGDMISVGAFGPRGIKRTSVQRVAYSPNDGNGIKTAKFSGPSIGVKTDGDSSKIFDAVVSLTATLNIKDSNNHVYSLGGTVHDFKGIVMNDIILKAVDGISEDGPIRGETHIVDETMMEQGEGNWQAGFASPNSIVGSYGISVHETHIIGSFGAYKDPANANEMNN